MAELERMVGQKVQSLHERVKAKEDTFRVRAPSHAPDAHWASDVAWQSCPPAMLQRLITPSALSNYTLLHPCDSALLLVLAQPCCTAAAYAALCSLGQCFETAPPRLCRTRCWGWRGGLRKRRQPLPCWTRR